MRSWLLKHVDFQFSSWFWPELKNKNTSMRSVVQKERSKIDGRPSGGTKLSQNPTAYKYWPPAFTMLHDLHWASSAGNENELWQMSMCCSSTFFSSATDNSDHDEVLSDKSQTIDTTHFGTFISWANRPSANFVRFMMVASVSPPRSRNSMLGNNSIWLERLIHNRRVGSLMFGSYRRQRTVCDVVCVIWPCMFCFSMWSVPCRMTNDSIF